MSIVWFVIGVVVGFLLTAVSLDRYYKEYTAQRLAVFSRDLMVEFAKATAEVENAKSRARNTQLN